MVQFISALAVQDFVKVNSIIIGARKVPSQPDLTFGVEALDKVLCLNFGQLIAFQGKPAHAMCTLLCVRAMLPQPLGPDCDVLFVDGGNNFDPYAISDSSVEQGLDSENVLERLHVSRAFTHHQLARILTDKLPNAIRKFRAKLVVVSDITQLYCDPDVRDDDKEDASRIFAKTARALRMFARQYQCLIVVTNLEPRNFLLDRTLTRAAHVLVNVKQNASLTQFSLKYPHLPSCTRSAFAPGVKTLQGYV
jgi:hypothetical protein